LTDRDIGEVVPITLEPGTGIPFRSFPFEAFIVSLSELRHVRSRVGSPCQHGVGAGERAFESLK
jgi:hypothetical protein